MNRIGLLGGTFDPLHIGHISLAQKAIDEYQLDYVVFIPSGYSYMKIGVTGSKCRYQMVEEALSDVPQFKASDIECLRTGPSYTYQTLQELQHVYPDSVLYLIIGADNLFQLELWKQSSLLFEMADILVAGRGTYNYNDIVNQISLLNSRYNARIHYLNMDAVPISSSEIRNKVKNGNSIIHDVPSKICSYITKHHLYGYAQNKFCTDICSFLSEELKPKRYEHSINVAKTAMHLAEIHHESIQKAQIAGLLHDCAKSMPDNDKMSICKEYGFDISATEIRNPELLHAKAGSIVAREKFDVTDDSILNAIIWHTTGKEEMTMLEKIIFVSDYIEPGRKHSSSLPILRTLSEKDLDETVYQILKDTVTYLHIKGTTEDIDINTENALHYYEINRRLKNDTRTSKENC